MDSGSPTNMTASLNFKITKVVYDKQLLETKYRLLF